MNHSPLAKVQHIVFFHLINRLSPMSVGIFARGLRVGALLVCAAVAMGLLAPVHAQDRSITPKRLHVVPLEQVHPNWEDCGLRKDPENVDTIVRGQPGGKAAKQGASIEVDYGSGFTPQAREAFERAVAVWEAHIDSSVPIRIQATFADLGANVLGGAGPNFIYGVDTTGTGGNDLIIGDALLDALSGQDQQPGQPDIVARFSSTRDDWHFGEGPTPDGQLDFMGVVLHEIGHGLNYFNLLEFSAGTGSYGVDFNGDGQVSESEKVPGIFDIFLAQETGGGLEQLTNASNFANPSSNLGDALTSTQLVFDGPSSRRAAEISTGPIPPQIYAPSSWQEGSSIAHLDEQTYRPGDPNALMSPIFNAGETARLPGPVVCGQMQDMLWPLATECQKFFSDVFSVANSTTNAEKRQGQVTLSWEVSTEVTVDEYMIRRQAFDGSFEVVAIIDGDAPTQTSPTGREYTLESQGLGQFTYELGWRTSDGTEGTALEQPTVTLNVQDVQATVDEGSRGPRGRGDVAVQWRVPPGTQDFSYSVQVAPGETGTFRETTLTARTDARVERQPPGRYEVRIVATDANGNVLTSPTATADIAFDGNVVVLGPFPNPTQGAATVDLTARNQQDVTVQVYDRLGRRLFQERRTVSARAPERIRVNTRSWASGLYFLRVVGNDFTETREIAVVR